MNLELNNEEHGLLVDLVDSRISELHPEIRRSMDHDFKDRLKRELDYLRALFERMKALGGEEG